MWDAGDYVIVTNADKLVVTWNKMALKTYYRYSGYKGNVKSYSLKWMMANRPLRVLELAVKGMLPKNKMRKGRLARLKLFKDDQHPYADKNPETLGN